MKTDNIKKYYEIFNRLLDLFLAVESALEDEDTNPELEDFMEVELDNDYESLHEMKEDINNIVVPKKRFYKTDYSDKIISFIYSSLIKFVTTNKVKDIPLSKKFLLIT